VHFRRVRCHSGSDRARPASGKPLVRTSETIVRTLAEPTDSSGRRVLLGQVHIPAQTTIDRGRLAIEGGWRSRAAGIVDRRLRPVLSTDAGAAMRAGLSECRSSIVTVDAAKHLLRVDSLSASIRCGPILSTRVVAT
jgi:hypothetical protein